MTVKSVLQLTLIAALSCANAASQDPVAKLDNGLGDLPPYSQWKDHPQLAHLVAEHRVEGEKLDSGLGDLPQYREWKNHPELARFVVESGTPVALRK